MHASLEQTELQTAPESPELPVSIGENGDFFSALHHAAQMDESIKITRHLCNCFRMHEIQLGVPFPVAKEDIQVALEGVCKGLSPSSQQQQIKT